VSPTELAAIGELAKNVTVIVLLLVIVYGGQKEWWVYGREYRRIIKSGARSGNTPTQRPPGPERTV
jgi:hypothetical protein